MTYNKLELGPKTVLKVSLTVQTLHEVLMLLYGM